MTATLHRRLEVLELAREHNFLILEGMLPSTFVSNPYPTFITSPLSLPATYSTNSLTPSHSHRRPLLLPLLRYIPSLLLPFLLLPRSIDWWFSRSRCPVRQSLEGFVCRDQGRVRHRSCAGRRCHRYARTYFSSLLDIIVHRHSLELPLSTAETFR